MLLALKLEAQVQSGHEDVDLDRLSALLVSNFRVQIILDDLCGFNCNLFLSRTIILR